MKKILLPVEDSELCRKASKIAGAIAKALNAKVFIFHVISEEELNRKDISPEEKMKLKKELEKRAKKSLRIAERNIKKFNAEYESIVKEGIPHEEIIDTAKKIKANLIVMGSHGRKGIAKLIDPSVSEKTLEHAPCDIVLVY